MRRERARRLDRLLAPVKDLRCRAWLRRLLEHGDWADGGAGPAGRRKKKATALCEPRPSDTRVDPAVLS
jgi:hypothetical protein